MLVCSCYSVVGRTAALHTVAIITHVHTTTLYSSKSRASTSLPRPLSAYAFTMRPCLGGALPPAYFMPPSMPPWARLPCESAAAVGRSERIQLQLHYFVFICAWYHIN